MKLGFKMSHTNSWAFQYYLKHESHTVILMDACEAMQYILVDKSYMA